MNIKNIITFGIVALIIVTTGCGSSGGATDNNRELTRVSGGTLYQPADMSLDIGNKIEANSFYNHFKYQSTRDETLALKSILEYAITKLERIECQESGSTYIAVYDAQLNQLEQYRTCSSTMTIDIEANTKYIFKIQYPGNHGYFNADATPLDR
jgi:hypothetical protein